jgi:acetyl-CoA C-acetyltransferase
MLKSTTKPAVIGYYSTKFGELWEKSLTDLLEESVVGALSNSCLKIEEIDAIFVSNMLAGILENNLHLNSKLAEILATNIPIFRLESACSSGGMAFSLGVNYLKSGVAKNILIVGAEKMTDYPADIITDALASASGGEEQQAGLTFPGLYGMLAQNYLQSFDYTEENLAFVAIKNHYHGSLNPKAHFKKEITLNQVLKSSYIAYPLKLLDCSPITDGAACLVVSLDKEKIKKAEFKAEIMASEVATDSISLKGRESLVELKATKIAGQKAFKIANLKPENINIAELHDCFSIAEILAMEDLGFWQKGTGGEKIISPDLMLNKGKQNSLKTNTSGGLKSCGHPIGATGIKQIGEVFLQITNQAQNRQVVDCKYGLAQNVGGSGGSCVVTILGSY